MGLTHARKIIIIFVISSVKPTRNLQKSCVPI